MTESRRRPIHWYNPGSSVTFRVKLVTFDPITKATKPLDVAGLSVTIFSTDGTSLVLPTPTHDALGVYHSSITLPRDAYYGEWTVAWQAIGATVDQNINEQYPFGVRKLAV